MEDDKSKFDDDFYDNEDAAFEEEFGEFDIDDEDDEFADGEGEGDEWGDEDGDPDFDGSDLMQKEKKPVLGGMSFNAIVITGAVIVGVGVFAFQLMTSKPKPTNDQFRSALNMQGATDNIVFGDDEKIENVQITVDQDEEQSSGGILQNPSRINEVARDRLREAPPMPVAQTVESQDDEELLLSKRFEQNEQLRDQFSMDDDMSQDQIPREPQSNEALEDLGQATLPDFTQGMNELTDNDTSLMQNNSDPLALEEPIQATNNVLEQIEAENLNRIETVEQPPEITESTMEISNSTLDARFAAMENQIQKLEEALEKERSADKNDQIAQLTKTVESLEKEIQKLKKQPKASTTKKTTSSSKSRSSAKQAVSNDWELRAAQPGKAWVAQKGQNELQPVVIGDILSGVGRVESIRFQQNRWIVQGSAGQIRQ
ncbi:MAG: hypothetical protein AAF549_02775 [Pseudomonadota bacterium]